MSKQTIHIKSPISRDDLDAVIIGLEIACGGIRIEVSEAFDLFVTDKRQAAALKALFGGNGQTPVEEVQKRKETKIQPGTHGSRKDSYYTFLTGELENQQTTGGALHLKLKAGKLDPGTCLSHPKYGNFVVVKDVFGKLSLCATPPLQSTPAS